MNAYSPRNKLKKEEKNLILAKDEYIVNITEYSFGACCVSGPLINVEDTR